MPDFEVDLGRDRCRAAQPYHRSLVGGLILLVVAVAVLVFLVALFIR